MQLRERCRCVRKGGMRIQIALIGMLMLASLGASAEAIAKPWGTTPDGAAVELFTLSDSALRVELTNFGARIVSLQVPDRHGKRADVVLGYNNFDQYGSHPQGYFGAVVGRYGNRLARGTFSLGGETYHVPLNNKGNALHGGTDGFDRKVWKARISGPSGVEFTLVSPDGDMGFPGTLTVHVRYTLEGGSLHIDYSARTTKPTVINLTNHTYYNLAGEGSGDVLGQELKLNASRFTPVDETLIPTGALLPVQGTAFDFRQLTPIGARIGAADEQLKRAGGYDHNFVLDGKPGEMHPAAFAVDPVSGRTLTITTTEPGVQFYSGNFLAGTVKGYTGQLYEKHGGFALETQHFPDSPNHPDFPSTTLLPGHEWHSSTVLRFGVAPAGDDARRPGKPQ